MSSEDKKNRSHLPMPNTSRPGLITYDAKDPDTKFPPIEQLRPPKGAPNVLFFMLEDIGYRQSNGRAEHQNLTTARRWNEVNCRTNET